MSGMHEKINGSQPCELLLERARGGDDAVLGSLLEKYRNYLRLLARTQIGHTLGLKLDASDLVQDTLVDAYRDFERFQGVSEPELVSWLRRILVRNLADQARHHRARKRDLHRQESLDVLLRRSSQAVHEALAATLASPSAQETRREQAVLLADALANLPDDYREVIVLRHLDRLKFDEIALRMGRSAGAVRKLWARALARLRSETQRPR